MSKPLKVPLDMLYERLSQYDPVSVLESLHITTEDLLQAFKSRIKKYREELSSELDVEMENSFQEEENQFDEYDTDQLDDFLVEEGHDDPTN